MSGGSDMRRILLGLALVLAAPVGAITIREAAPELPAWMAGAWEQIEGERWNDEFWTPPRGDIMIGAARIGSGSKLELFEHTRIVRKPDGMISFFAQPRGAPSAEFPVVAIGADWIEFANAAHDYPQRIRYWREGQLLRARISLMDGSKAFEWTYQPMGGSK